MTAHWEWWLLGVLLVAVVVHIIAYEWFLWRATRRWVRTLPMIPMNDDEYHLRGYDAKPNVWRAR